jgi:hypothetical protein
MSLTDRTEMRRCGHRYATELDARCSKRGLADGAVIEECWVPGCEGWHVRSAASVSRHPLPQGSDTGPDKATREAVYERDGWCCVCCGQSVIGRPHSVAHRKRRSQGGTLCLANLVTALGFGNGLVADDHHFRIDSRIDPHDEAKGYTVRSHQDPHLVSVMVFGPGGGGASLFATCDGQWSSSPGQVSA